MITALWCAAIWLAVVWAIVFALTYILQRSGEDD